MPIYNSLYISIRKKCMPIKGRTKSALLIWTKSDLSDKVFNRYFTIWPRFGMLHRHLADKPTR